jgi:hypothetical protein
MDSSGVRTEAKRPALITGLAVMYFVSAAAIVLFLFTNFVLSFPLRSTPILIPLVPIQCAIGLGLWKLRNWARLTTVILSAFFGFPSIIKMMMAFNSLSFVDLSLNLSFVTLQGMTIWYLLHPETRAAFDTSPTVLNLK